MLENLPDLLLTYGPFAIVLATTLGAFGLPSPASLTLIAAGALSVLGGLDYPVVVIAGLIGTVFGDHLAYWLARSASKRLENFGPMKRLGPAQRLIDRHGMIGVFLSRFVFPPLMTPTGNYVAGISRMPLRRFTPAVVTGELVYVLLFSGLGRFFSTQIAQVHRVASTASLLLLVAVIAIICVFALVRALFRETPDGVAESTTAGD